MFTIVNPGRETPYLDPDWTKPNVYRCQNSRPATNVQTGTNMWISKSRPKAMVRERSTSYCSTNPLIKAMFELSATAMAPDRHIASSCVSIAMTSSVTSLATAFSRSCSRHYSVDLSWGTIWAWGIILLRVNILFFITVSVRFNFLTIEWYRGWNASFWYNIHSGAWNKTITSTRRPFCLIILYKIKIFKNIKHKWNCFGRNVVNFDFSNSLNVQKCWTCAFNILHKDDLYICNCMSSCHCGSLVKIRHRNVCLIMHGKLFSNNFAHLTYQIL